MTTKVLSESFRPAIKSNSASSYQLKDVGGAAAAVDYRLVTTLLDARRHPARQLAALYRERWEIESVFAEIKTFQRGAKVVLSSKTPDGVLQQIWAHLLVHHALRTRHPDFCWSAGLVCRLGGVLVLGRVEIGST
jgi:DDE family transposase